MSTSREAFLVRVRAAQRVALREDDHPAPGARDPFALPPLPVFDTPAGDRTERFGTNLTTMGGELVALGDARELCEWLAERFPGVRPVSATPEAAVAERLDVRRAPASLHDVDVGVVRARYGVAETGSVWLSEREYGVNALGYLVQHLVVLLDPRDIVDGLQDIYRKPDFAQARYAVLVTGPSATADIEGVLIRGAQGVRSLTVVLLPRD
ncbi:LUD domain-containing protein [Pandoraea sp. CB10b_02]|uniref:LutC/YkgG family protein n=1 Tax=Pandoraea sp. CB10b_02 TaxID=2014535 RepID=UPI002579D2D6|nr:LUD domain-containing protein [Pandoraea sp. CB10b_02]